MILNRMGNTHFGKVILWAFMISLHLTTIAQDAKPNKPKTFSKTDSIFIKANNFSSKYESDSAIKYYNLAAEAYLSSSDSSGYFLSKIKIASEHVELGQFALAYPLLDSILLQNQGEGSNRIRHEAYTTYGRILEYEGRFAEAIEKAVLAILSNYEPKSKEGKNREAKLLYRKGFSQFQSRLFEDAAKTMEASRSVFSALNKRMNEAMALAQLGSIKVQLLKADEALSYFNKCKEIYVKFPDSVSFEDKGILSLNIGDAYRNLGLLPEAINYLKDAGNEFSQISKDHQALTVVYPQLGFTYVESGEPEKAIGYLEEGLKLCLRYYGKSNFRTVTNQQILGVAYMDIPDFEKAIEQFENATEVLQTDLAGAAPDILAKLIFEIGFSQYNLGETEKGLMNMRRGISMSFGDGIHLLRQVTLLSKRIGRVFLEMNQPDSARKYYQMSLQVSSEKVNSTKPNPQLAYHFNRYESFLGKAASFEALYEKDQTTFWLDSAFNMLTKAENEISFFREFPSRLSEQLEMGTQLSESFNSGIRISYKLYELTQKKVYAEYAYRLIEQSKSNQAFFNTESQVQIDLPEPILVQEKKLNLELSSFETLLYQALQKEEPDSKQIADYEMKITSTTNELISLSQQIRTDYPGYYQLKYDREYLSIEETQEFLLSVNQLLINYHYTDTDLFVFEVSQSDYSFVKKTLDKDFESSILQFSELVKKPNTSQGALNSYIELSNKISKVLLPSFDKSSISSITIVPDGPLHLVPFSALLNEFSKEADSFRELPYLLKDIDFHYGTSSSLLAKQKGKKNRMDRAVGFAPSFSETSLAPDSVRASLGNLANTKKEVENIAAYFDTDNFFDSLATEKAFRNAVEDYSIVHLASHGIVDSKNSLFSKILFSPYDTDSINDGFLNTREILGMNIPANMVVLSACNTGSGALSAGEGVMSLANGFFYAGAKSVVMTLWTANDESTANIMGNFYENLSNGETKSQALRAAKLDYLKNANSLSAHPYYWAHFVVNGDDSSIVQHKSPWYLIASLVVGLIFLGFFIRKKKTVA